MPATRSHRPVVAAPTLHRMTSDTSAAWLPDHQLHVLATLAHVDGLISNIGSVLFDYVSGEGPLEFANVTDGFQVRVTVKAVAPLPEVLPRYVADALTQMRATIEHAVYAEVEHELGRPLDEHEARCIEMPALTKSDELEKWLARSGRPKLPPLHHGTHLVRRIDDLQPYHRRDADQHPLRLLAQHTNWVKHRTPAVAATRIGIVIPDRAHPQLVIHDWDQDRPLQPGDTLASGPEGLRVPLSIVPTVSVQRPHTRTWHVLMHELRDLEEWVRTVAIPHLVVGTQDLGTLQPQLDIMTGHSDLRAALRTAGEVPAAIRAERRLQAVIAREGLVDALALHPRRFDRSSIRAWVNSLDDGEVLDRHERLADASATGGLRAVADYAARLLDEVLAHARRTS